MKVLGLVGSLRAGSLNQRLYDAARELAPAGMTFEQASIRDLPLYDEDLKQDGFPAVVERLRQQIAGADALLFVTPEYNYSVSGVLKNAIDWASRPPNQPFDGKPIAIMGATPSTAGTTRAQLHLRQIIVYLNMHPLNKPEVLVAGAAAKFDADGRLTDETTRDIVRQTMQALSDWTARLSA